MINKLIANIIPWFPKPFIWQFSKKYVAGETLETAMQVSRELNEKGMMVTIDMLGEFIKNMNEARDHETSYYGIIDAITTNKIKGGVSLKPTFFGLTIDKEESYTLIRNVVKYAAERSCFVRIDMEDSECTTDEIELFRKLKAEFPKDVGLVVQAYLKRTTNDVLALQDIQMNGTPLNFRLCKGIYVEPEKIAYKDYQRVRDNYLALLEQMIKAGNYVAIATHDRYLVEGAINLIDKYKLPKTAYEFQMLYGVTPNLRDEIVANGNRMRIYVPYGQDWFGYCTRRLKENPKMTSDIIKGIFVKG
ncbi:proline dehydrogenase family protein [Saccharicrinis sp. FJH62]|uniref:proline dehydrogenase family protein n=1 Tax=Saccharicrinis sp. FJH62 TaxID=3344657 RepID=UPI0035D4C596